MTCKIDDMADGLKIEYSTDELNDEYSNDDLLNIQSWGVDLSVQDLLYQYKEGDILKPELQRNYVWDKKEASRFVESLLLGLPVPSIFLANMADGVRLIVDGYQRIMTLYHYVILGKWKDTEETFKLTNTDLINPKWRNKSFKELEIGDQRRLRLYTIHAIVFEQKRPRSDSSLFQVFERINTSGKSLNAQEIRNCVYQGDLNSLLIQLNSNPDWRYLFGNQNPDERMLDMELILRFFAMNNEVVYNSTRKYISLKQLLNNFMGMYVHANEQLLVSLTNNFNDVISFIKSNFGETAFFNLQNDFSKYRRRLYPTVYDSLMIATSIALGRGYHCEGASLEEKKLNLLKNDEYREAITQGTMQVVNIHKRISMVLSSIYNMDL